MTIQPQLVMQFLCLSGVSLARQSHTYFVFYDNNLKLPLATPTVCGKHTLPWRGDRIIKSYEVQFRFVENWLLFTLSCMISSGIDVRFVNIA